MVVIVNRFVVRVVIQRVDCKVAACGVVGLRAEGVVAQHAPVGVGSGIVIMQRTESGDFDEFLSDHDMHDLEAPSDDARPTADAFDLLRRGVGRDVEVLGVAPEQQIAHGAADHEGLITGALQVFADTFSATAQHVVRDAVFFNWNDFRFYAPRRMTGFLKEFFDETANHPASPICLKISAGGVSSRRVMTGQPARVAWVVSVSSASTATGWVDHASSGRSLCESL